jgi:hypothetical protein
MAVREAKIVVFGTDDKFRALRVEPSENLKYLPDTTAMVEITLGKETLMLNERRFKDLLSQLNELID